MNVLLVHSGNAVNQSSEYTFVKQQGDALARLGVNVFFFAVRGKGIRGYLHALPALREKIKKDNIDLIHAHYGFCGALAVLQRRVPVIITFHNGETLTKKGKLISSIAAWLCDYRIFVAQHIHDKLFRTPREYEVIPCGIDLDKLVIIEKGFAMQEMNLSSNIPNVLFGGSFSNARKNYPLAKDAISRLGYPVNLIEMRGYDREQVNKLLCGCDLFLLPTKSEGSPQVIKEALACNCPIVATAVADIPDLLSGVENCFATSFDAGEIAMRIDLVLRSGKKSNGRKKVIQMGLDNMLVAERILRIYIRVLSKRRIKSKVING